MTLRGSAPLLLGLLWAVIGNADCSRANLHAITGTAARDGSVAADGRDSSSPTDSGTAVDSGGPVTCPSSVLKPGNTTQTLTDNRTYVLHVPDAYDGSKPVPLIVDFHALFGSGSGELSSSPYPALTNSEGVVMAFPDGKKGPAGAAWNVGPCCVAKVDDVDFARRVVAQIESTACIDPNRIYAIGTSMGGGMAYYLACHAADLFAAVAPSAFDLFQENVGDCNPTRPITVISFRGMADTVVPYAGGPSSTVSSMPVTFLGAEKTFETWAAIDGCTGSASASDSNGCSAYSGCPTDVEVILCTKEGGRQEVGNPSVAWPVLKRHTL